ncbi:hypothetical protein AAC387_Pa05g2080 [Persea americana]
MRFPCPDYIPITTTPSPAGVVENGKAPFLFMEFLSGIPDCMEILEFPSEIQRFLARISGSQHLEMPKIAGIPKNHLSIAHSKNPPTISGIARELSGTSTVVTDPGDGKEQEGQFLLLA